MYVLVDTFNGRVLSRHRLLTRAVKAECALSKHFRGRSDGSYLPTTVAVLDKEGVIQGYSGNTIRGVRDLSDEERADYHAEHDYRLGR